MISTLRRRWQNGRGRPVWIGRLVMTKRARFIRHILDDSSRANTYNIAVMRSDDL